jgi:hypothetical protein
LCSLGLVVVNSLTRMKIEIGAGLEVQRLYHPETIRAVIAAGVAFHPRQWFAVITITANALRMS